MVEALADVALVTTIPMAYADNIRQQTTINIEARGKVMSGGGNNRGVVVAVVTTATTAVAVAGACLLQRLLRQLLPTLLLALVLQLSRGLLRGSAPSPALQWAAPVAWVWR